MGDALASSTNSGWTQASAQMTSECQDGLNRSGVRWPNQCKLAPLSAITSSSVFEKDGCKVVCDNMSLEFIKGSKIEFEDSLMRSAFVVSKTEARSLTSFTQLQYTLTQHHHYDVDLLQIILFLTNLFFKCYTTVLHHLILAQDLLIKNLILGR